MTTKSNIFANLDVDDEETNHRKNERKAIKKLKAINILKKKELLTDDEQLKVDSEDYWHRILDPSYENMETKKENELREQQKVTKNKELERQRDEQRQRQRQRQKEEQRERQIYTELKTKNEKRINIEFNILLSQGNNNKKAKKQLQIKYHPDRNFNNKAMADEMSKIVNNIVT